jgi:colanic acid/amylovoran biosynthesis glycosyltransferase
LVRLYAKSHLFLHPSETPADQNQEGVPNSVLEAMSTGLPVVATRHGGIPEAVEHGRTGLLVAEGDFVALADAVASLFQDPARMEEIGWRASEAVAANFEQGEQIRQLESYYEEAIAVTQQEERATVSGSDSLPTPFPVRVPVE